MTNTLLKAAMKYAAPTLAQQARKRIKRAMHTNGNAFGNLRDWAEDRMPERFTPARRTPDYGRMALTGLGAAALAVPLGIWAGRMMRERQQH